jgi:uncharacterized protein
MTVAADRHAATRPAVRHYHLFEAEPGPHVLVTEGSRVYALPDAVHAELARAADAHDDAMAEALLARYGLFAPAATDTPPTSMPMRSLSLAIAQTCNLGCTYCYAEQGAFGGTAKVMDPEVALRAVERLIGDAEPGAKLQLAFLGGEPLANRAALRATTEHAARLAAARDVAIGFAVTTNGTLLRPDDGEFFDRHGFAVTVSLDGVGAVHDQLRPARSGRPTYERIMARVVPILAARRARMQVSARVTVTPSNLGLLDTLEAFLEAGFDSVGFSPMLSSPTSVGEMQEADLDTMLGEMLACARRFEQRVLAGEEYPFLNAVTALREIHRGTHRPYPCGAGAGYFGASADGALFACHRFVGDEERRMGDIGRGIDLDVQQRWLGERHVDRQQPCGGCWARYLCGGGCHHEVLRRGRPACDYVRGWLDGCLRVYARISEHRPGYLASIAGV